MGLIPYHCKKKPRQILAGLVRLSAATYPAAFSTVPGPVIAIEQAGDKI
jgi:hypothetical protein